MGHVMRCRALAAAFREQGWSSVFAMSEASAMLFAEDTPIVAPDGLAGAAAINAAIVQQNAGCLVVDHYGLDAEFEREAAKCGALTIAIDDLANRPHDCDLLVDSNPGRTATDYAEYTVARTKLLLGGGYALLRKEFAMRRRSPNEDARSSVQHVVIATGGADPDNVSARLLEVAPRLKIAGMKTTLIVGQANPHQADLIEAGHAAGADVICNPRNPVALMASADIAISGAGTTCLEFACLGVPTVALILADNQRAVAKAIRDAGAGWIIDDGPPFDAKRVADVVISIATDAVARKRMGAAGQAMIDGGGATRVAAEAVRLYAVRKEQCV
jgi:UDP-2,4-diacetamido-2,4,6-trideoxy-beta-L-altropyranose hydrolase